VKSAGAGQLRAASLAPCRRTLDSSGFTSRRSSVPGGFDGSTRGYLVSGKITEALSSPPAARICAPTTRPTRVIAEPLHITSRIGNGGARRHPGCTQAALLQMAATASVQETIGNLDAVERGDLTINSAETRSRLIIFALKLQQLLRGIARPGNVCSRSRSIRVTIPNEAPPNEAPKNRLIGIATKSTSCERLRVRRWSRPRRDETETRRAHFAPDAECEPSRDG